MPDATSRAAMLRLRLNWIESINAPRVPNISWLPASWLPSSSLENMSRQQFRSHQDHLHLRERPARRPSDVTFYVTCDQLSYHLCFFAWFDTDILASVWALLAVTSCRKRISDLDWNVSRCNLPRPSTRITSPNDSEFLPDEATYWNARRFILY